MRKIRLDLGSGHYIDSDVPSPEIIEMMKHLLPRVNKPKTDKDRADIKLVMEWLDLQSSKYGNVKNDS